LRKEERCGIRQMPGELIPITLSSEQRALIDDTQLLENGWRKNKAAQYFRIRRRRPRCGFSAN
jgi:hypothetical protein